MSAEELALRLRKRTPPVFARIQENRVLIDPRTLLEGEEEALTAAIVEALRTG
jgi:L-seryl-tRNA(Ser) seleniumtransferase